MSTEITESGDKIPLELKELLDQHKYQECLEGLKDSAISGNMASALALAEIYKRGGGGVEADFAAARWWYTHYSKKRYHPYVFFQLAKMYYAGQGVDRNLTIAFRLFRHMIIMKNVEGRTVGRLMSGAMMARGEGTKKKKRSGKVLLWRSFKDARLAPNERLLALLWWAGFATRWSPDIFDWGIPSKPSLSRRPLP